ncbi:MAG TPA: LacI family DNA-binding transcriptional regulator [Armatimonadota bacterium]
MTTIRQLADLAGVSRMTAWRALRNDSRVQPEVRREILALAAAYQYKPSYQTAPLATPMNGVLGFITPRASATYYTNVLDGVMEEAFLQSYHVVVMQTFVPGQSQALLTRKALHTLADQRVSGVLIAAGFAEPLHREDIMLLQSRRIVPVALDATAIDLPINRALTDERKVAELVLDHLFSFGHRDILYAGLGVANQPLTTRDAAMLSAMKKRGLPPSACVLAETEERVCARLLHALTASAVTAVAAHNDGLAAQIMRSVLDSGKRLPEDVSLIGCGNLPIGNYLPTALTTVDQHPEDVGRLALQLLVEAIHYQQEHAAPLPVRTMVVLPELVIRRSCTVPPPR